MTTLIASEAHARRGGTAVDGCHGCHGGGAAPGITIDHSPKNPAAGEAVTLEVQIQAANISAGGIYLRTGTGRLSPIDGQGTHLIDDRQLVHSAPKRASGGVVRFDAQWIAPGAPGGVVVDVWAVSANGDNDPRGDGASAANTAFVYGCESATYYLDRDGDGYGDSGVPRVDCALPAEHAPEHAPRGGDCDDYSVNVHPQQGEACNGIDDDCDGQVDEDLAVTTQFEDADGDGYGSRFGATVEAKCPPDGYAPSSSDCDDRAPDVHPDAVETCNLIDDDCDGRVDEGVREVCGVGMCARESIACTPGSCTPGEPSPETCNALDDDCDGETDEDPGLCAPGEGCPNGTCSRGTGGGAPGSTGAGASGASGGGAPDEGGDRGGSCAVDPRGGSPWRLLLLSPLALLASRRPRRAFTAR
ncbi:putative metal-binding motif-containing protein [Sorangium atrum]|uniref:Metal-binding motif-containing protein n=1 Tax=Sorangium atrum TaxID=2995308 RepID=A0ABT5BVL3_9BACT|nr:putative metal-binding motif-containing protein [Sorangium aterium]MDC0677733.1 putative metal-binding motif-containing protein [Sorangium aterium]